MHAMVVQETQVSNSNGTFFVVIGTAPAEEHIDRIYLTRVCTKNVKFEVCVPFCDVTNL